MGTRIVKPCKRGSNLDSLTDKRRIFVLEYLADSSYDAANAARKAGYKHPQQAANKLMNDKKIAAIIGKQQRLREEKLGLNADDLRKYLAAILDLVPSDYAIMSGDGYLIVKDLTKLPKDIAKFVEGFEAYTMRINGKDEIVQKVKMISKTTALSLLVKVEMVEQHEHKVKHSMDWDTWLGKSGDETNVIEARLIEEENK